MLFVFIVQVPFTLSFHQHAASLGFARLETTSRVDYCWDSFRTGERWFGPEGVLQNSQVREVPVENGYLLAETLEGTALSPGGINGKSAL